MTAVAARKEKRKGRERSRLIEAAMIETSMIDDVWKRRPNRPSCRAQAYPHQDNRTKKRGERRPVHPRCFDEVCPKRDRAPYLRGLRADPFPPVAEEREGRGKGSPVAAQIRHDLAVLRPRRRRKKKRRVAWFRARIQSMRKGKKRSAVGRRLAPQRAADMSPINRRQGDLGRGGGYPGRLKNPDGAILRHGRKKRRKERKKNDNAASNWRANLTSIYRPHCGLGLAKKRRGEGRREGGSTQCRFLRRAGRGRGQVGKKEGKGGRWPLGAVDPLCGA